MANLQAQGGAPVSLVDANGVQYSIPLTLISFAAATGMPEASGFASNLTAPQAAALQSLLPGWLQTLAGQGLLSAGAQPAVPPAFTVTARDGGSTGNDITLAITKVVPNGAAPAQTAVDATVTSQQVYAGLTLASIAAVLGAAPGGGAQPGLAYVGGAVGTVLPTATAAPQGFSGTPAQLVVAGSGGNAFTLVPTHSGSDVSFLTASISAVDTAKGSFTLTLKWSKPVTGAPLGTLNAAFGYVLTIAPPPGGFSYPPAPGQVTLLGGTDPSTSSAPATAAQAIVVAG